MQVVNENENMNQQEFDEECRNWEKRRKRGKIMVGIALVAAGAIWLAKRMGMFVPAWVFSWPMLLVVLGVISLVKHGFRNFGWLILMAIGGLFLFERFFPDASVRTWIWPVAIMMFGLVIIFKPRRKFNHHRWHRHWKHKAYWDEKKNGMYNQAYNKEGRLEVNAVFGGVRKAVITKNFSGGEINCVFGGSEINLLQADFEGTVRLEVNQVFGSTTLIIPPHWKLRPQFTTVLGGVEDKRANTAGQVYDDNKVLELEGNCVFGGLQIKSH